MVSELNIALDSLYNLLRKNVGSDSEVVAVDVRFTSEGYFITYEYRTSEALRKSSITMRNICGEWILKKTTDNKEESKRT